MLATRNVTISWNSTSLNLTAALRKMTTLLRVTPSASDVGSSVRTVSFSVTRPGARSEWKIYGIALECTLPPIHVPRVLQVPDAGAFRSRAIVPPAL